MDQRAFLFHYLEVFSVRRSLLLGFDARIIAPAMRDCRVDAPFSTSLGWTGATLNKRYDIKLLGCSVRCREVSSDAGFGTAWARGPGSARGARPLHLKTTGLFDLLAGNRQLERPLPVRISEGAALQLSLGFHLPAEKARHLLADDRWHAS